MSRIVKASSPPPQPGRAASSSPGLAERFQRVLGLARRDPLTRTGPVAIPLLFDEEQFLPIVGTGDEQQQPDPQTHEPEVADPEVAEPATAELHGPESHPLDAAKEPTSAQQPGGDDTSSSTGAGEGGAMPSDAASPAVQPPAWLGQTADLVLSLCAGVPPSFQSWRLTMPLDAEPLSGSELDLTLSPDNLSLRFRTGSSASADLVLRHRSQLAGMLAELPAMPSNIDIDID